MVGNIEAKTVELAPSGFDVKSFPRQSRSCGGGITTVYKSTFGSNITFKTNFDFANTLFDTILPLNKTRQKVVYNIFKNYNNKKQHYIHRTKNLELT